MMFSTHKEIITALKDAKSPQDKNSIVQSVSKEYISRSLQKGDSSISLEEKNQDVKIIQTLLAGLGFLSYNQMSGQLDQNTMNAIKKFASKSNINVDINKPLSKEVIDLFTAYQSGGQDYPEQIEKYSKEIKPPTADKYNWPPVPTDLHRPTLVEKENMFGKIEWSRGKGDGIIISNNFVKDNIVTIDLPQLAKIQKPPKGTKIRCHRLAAKPILTLWQEWENLGLLNRIENWAGCFVPRTIRGIPNALSNHAFGTAFDINSISNGLRKMPPAVGEPGSVRELVPTALKLGFYWGGHFGRKDGMHFELVRVDPQQMIA